MSKAVAIPLLLDTCALIWLSADDLRFQNSSSKTKIEKSFRDQQLYISPISFWEISMLNSKGRLKLNQPVLDWIKSCIQKYNLQTVNLSPEISVESCQLPGGFHSDPADRIIVATARIYGFTLLTEDQLILDYGKNGLLKVLNCF
jgi:PIN domain nuclease of toxin-antitoxin system